MPTVRMQRSHMNQFLDTLIQKQKKRAEGQLMPYSMEQQLKLENKRGIGYLLEQVTDVSQIIPDERPIDDPMVLQSENPEKVLQIKNLMSQSSIRWFKCEYFYSSIDKPFFQENELMETLNDAGMPTELNRREWAIIRQSLSEKEAIPKKNGSRPRRLFSAQFIIDEKQKLERHRTIFREIMNQYQ